MTPEEAEKQRIVRDWQKFGTRPDELKPGQCVVDSEDADFAWVREGEEPPKRIRLFVRTCCAEATATERERCGKVADSFKENCNFSKSCLVNERIAAKIRGA